ncbi:XF1762 family protein [Streptomyces kronopolitis]|uniref:XF1762 family protein n=1 Tax=Streptomyces kronopolitis TaxID=1612435 RepID=UPI003434C094
MSFNDACAFIAQWHRHHAPPRGYKGCVGAALDTTLIGVAIVGRPVARHLDDGQTLEVTRVATDGTRNTSSLLYAACWDIAKGMGYARLITYTQQGESGASLRAAGWRLIANRPARPGWDRPSRPRSAHGTEHMPRFLWEAS